MAACFLWRFRSGKWKAMRVIEAAPDPVVVPRIDPQVPSAEHEHVAVR
jgi:hypothetical protein